MDDATRWPRRLAATLGWVALGVAVLGVGWVVVTGLLARAQLEQVRASLPQVRSALASGNLHEAQSLTTRIRSQAERAHGLTTGPAWWVTADLPWLGRPLRSTRAITAAADRIGQDSLPGLLTVADTVEGSSLRSGSHVDVTALARVAPALHRSSTGATTATAIVRSAPRSSWLSAVDDARASLLTELGQLQHDLNGADLAVRTALPMLGQSGPRRYFVAFENEAESRGLGGLPGAFAIATADHGTVRFTHFGPDSELDGVSSGLDLGPEYAARYGSADPTGNFLNSDISPNFPDAARIWAAMWQRKSGQRVDGAIALDPTALSQLLQVTGPATLPDGSPVSAADVVQIAEKTQYAAIPDKSRRKAFLASVARAAATQITGSHDAIGLIHAAAHAVGERRIVVWSADRRVERNLVEAGYAGVLRSSGRPFAGFTVVNAAASKLDYYLGRRMTYRRSGCGAGDSALASLVLANDAPRRGLPAYVTTRADHPPRGAQPGDNHLLVTYYGSAGARLEGVTVDGEPVTVAAGTENGLLAVTLNVEVPAGARVRVTMRIHEPAAPGPPDILRQPLARPLQVSVSGASCG